MLISHCDLLHIFQVRRATLTRCLLLLSLFSAILGESAKRDCPFSKQDRIYMHPFLPGYIHSG